MNGHTSATRRATLTRVAAELPWLMLAVLIAKRLLAPQLADGWDLLALLTDQRVAALAVAPVRMLVPAMARTRTGRAS